MLKEKVQDVRRGVKGQKKRQRERKSGEVMAKDLSFQETTRHGS